MPLTGGDLLLECLRAQGVRGVFGMPGTQNIALYDALGRACAKQAEPPLQHFLIRHEQGATMLANGWARATGDVAVAFTVPGPGASNAATGILDAWNDCIPVLLVVGGFNRSMARRDRAKMFHGLNQEPFFAPITRYFGRPASANDIPRIVSEAFMAMFAGRPGPAVIELGPDVAAEAVTDARPGPFVPRCTTPAPSTDDVTEAARQILRLKKPVIIVGRDCLAAGACEEVRRLAELLQAPVLYGRCGKGVLPDAHPLSAGFLRASRSAALLREADGVIAVGPRFTQIDTRDWTLTLPKTVIQFDRDPLELGREYPITTGVAGGLREALDLLLHSLPQTVSHDAAWKTLVDATIAQWKARPAIPILQQIRTALPQSGLISVDVTAVGYNCFDCFDVPGPRSLIYPSHSVALGMGFPAALGAKLAEPERAVVSVSGDGGFLMTCEELAVAVEAKASVVAVVVKDDCLSAIKGSQRQAFEGRTIDTDMTSPDFVALARSFGAHADATSNPDDLLKLIPVALGRTGPTVIEVDMRGHVDEMIDVIPWLNGE